MASATVTIPKGKMTRTRSDAFVVNKGLISRMNFLHGRIVAGVIERELKGKIEIHEKELLALVVKGKRIQNIASEELSREIATRRFTS